MKARLLLATSLALLPALASAHPGHDSVSFLQGALHPLTGLDHLLVMLAVGLWAAQRGGRTVWALPAGFVAMLVAGAAFAHVTGAVSGAAVPGQLEQAIAMTVTLCGLLVAFAVRAPGALGVAIVGAFALLHGYAHGVEAPAGGSVLGYGAGFVLSSLALHAAGIGLGVLCSRLHWGTALRWSGGGVAATGLLLLAG